MRYLLNFNIVIYVVIDLKRMKEDLFDAMDRCMNSRKRFKKAYEVYDGIYSKVSDKIMGVFKIAQAELKHMPLF